MNSYFDLHARRYKLTLQPIAPTQQVHKLEDDIERNKTEFIGLMDLSEALQRASANRNVYSV